MKTIHFTIPKPCHENWNQMSPEEKGRFCDKCAKTVLDFSSKTTTEIQEYISEHQNEKLCGRFRNDQLKQPVKVKILYWSPTNRLSVAQNFFLALLIVFGTTLFSCTTHKDEIVGEIAMDNPVMAFTPPEVTGTDSLEPMIMGKIKRMPFNDRLNPIQTTIEFIPPETPNDTTIDLPEVDINESKPVFVCYTVGAIAYSSVGYVEGDILNDEDSVASDVPVIASEGMNELSMIYPNPAHESTNLKFYISTEKEVEVQLFDLYGKLIRTILKSQRMPEGESDIRIDLTDIKPATYLMRLIKDGVVETKRIVVL